MIKECYDAKTTMTTVVNVSLLFTTREHVTQFNQTLDKLEQLYDNLAQHDKASDASTYVSTINLTTPQQYKWVATMLNRQISHYNQYVTTASMQHQTMTSTALI